MTGLAPKRWSRAPGARRAVVALFAITLVASKVSATSADQDLSPEELSRLASGELVVRPTTETRGTLRLIGGTAFQVIDTAPELVWRALLDVRYYHRMLPQVTKAEVVNEQGHTRTVYLRHGHAPLTAAYFLTMKVDAKARDISFKLDHTRAHDIQEAWGFYTVRPYASGKTLVAFGVLADPGEGVVRALMRSSIHEWLLKVPWMVKRFVEGSGRYIYRPRRASAPAERSH